MIARTVLDNINIQHFSTTSSHETYLMEINGRFFEIGADTAQLLQFFKKQGCDDASIDAYIQHTQGKYTKEAIVQFLDSLEKS